MARDPIAPDIAIIGAARAGTSFLSATLSNHPQIDGGAVKEPNYFSSKWSEGSTWYDGLFEPKDAGLIRLDSSVSYTYPQHVAALERLHDANPDVLVVYAVREPVARLVSHYQLMRYYVGHDKWPTLSAALDGSPMFMGSGAYDVWIPRVKAIFPTEHVLVVPFPALTEDVTATSELILGRLGLDPTPSPLAAPSFRNDVREFRSPLVKRLHRRAMKSKAYPMLRARVGPDRLRRVRGSLTRTASLPSAAAELASLSRAQINELVHAAERSTSAVRTYLMDQDAALQLDWAVRWEEHIASAPALPIT